VLLALQMQLNMKHLSAEPVSKELISMTLHSQQNSTWRRTGDGDDPLQGRQEE
jgi:hypothetical protein